MQTFTILPSLSLFSKLEHQCCFTSHVISHVTNVIYEAVKKRQYSWHLNGCSCNIPKSLHHLPYPREKDMDFGEDMRILGIITVTFIGVSCDTLKLGVADKWSTRITLANPSLLSVKFGAQHVTGVEVLLPYSFALRAELYLLLGLPQYI